MIVMHSWACQMEHVVWSRHAKPGIVSPDVIFKAMRLVSSSKSGQRKNMAKYQPQRKRQKSGEVSNEREWEGQPSEIEDS